MTRILAFDYGASSGRAMLAQLKDGAITMEEIHRFANEPVQVNGTLYWDVLRLFWEMKEGIRKAALAGGFDYLGIDTWGVDFGLIDREGRLMENPVHYRDARTDGVPEQFFARMGREALYGKTGIQLLNFNTVFQLFWLSQNRPELLERADKLLFIPDLFHFFLTGEKYNEYTIASTSALLNAATRGYADAVLAAAGVSQRLFCPMVQPGWVSGAPRGEICAELGAPKAKVVAVGCHDTASAVVAVPAEEEGFIYISCGTWSLFGTELAEPVLTPQSCQMNMTNEGGYGGTIRYLRNIMGLWLIQQAKRTFERRGEQVSYASLEQEALAAPAFRSFVDPDDDLFVKPGDMPARVQEFCRRTGQPVPESRGEIMRCIYESLAFKYRYVLESLVQATGRDYRAIHMVGGGTKDGVLCQLTANSCGLPVMAGPIEATVLGNIAVCLQAAGEVSGLGEMRRVIARSFPVRRFEPQDTALWDASYSRFCSYVKTK